MARRGGARRRRELTISKIQAALQVDRDLAEHMHDRQVEPQVKAARLRDQGHDVDVALVNVGASTEGFEVSCVGCGRTARLSFKPPSDKKLVCPDCQRG